MSPVFSHGDLRLYLLHLLSEGPRHGYDLIQALTERTGGTYTPSAGTIYPRLAKLDEEGLVRGVSDGRRTVYEITDAGRAELDARSGELDGIEHRLADSVRLIADEVRGSVREAMRSLKADLAAAGQATPRQQAGPYTAPADPRVASRAELQRADAAINDFRATVRTELRGHVARGGELDPAAVDQLIDALANARQQLSQKL